MLTKYTDLQRSGEATMDPEIREYYQRESHYIIESFGVFAHTYPKIAGRLGAQAGDVRDCYAMRLLQGFAFVAARSQMRIDRWSLDIPLRTLERVNPNFAAPLPSVAVARFYPDAQAAHNPHGLTLQRGTQLTPHTKVRGPSAEFRTSQPVTVWPLEIATVRATGVPADIPSLYRFVSDSQSSARVRGALRLRLATLNGMPFCKLEGLDRLPIYLSGDERLASRLFELIHTCVIGIVMGVPGQFESGEVYGARLPGRSYMNVEYEGLKSGESMLRPVMQQFHGCMLVHEFFALPARFWFFALTGLAAGLKRMRGPEVEIVLLLSCEVASLDQQIDVTQFALFCTPVSNLFPKTTTRLAIDGKKTEHRVTPITDAPDDYEVHSVDLVSGQVEKDSEKVVFQPLDTALPDDTLRQPRYFMLWRELDVSPDNERRYEVRQQFVHTRTRLKLFGLDGEPDDSGVQYVTLQAWLTNGELPCMLPRDGINDLVVKDAKAVASVGFVRGPTVPKPPLALGARGQTAWALVRQLQLELAIFDDEFDESKPGEGLRQTLLPYLGAGDPTMERWLDSLIGASVKPVYDMHPIDNELQLTRGMAITLTFDEHRLDGWSPFTFALALERYVARHVSSHSFTRTVLQTGQRGVIFAWPTRSGMRGVF
ncbi:type VI secretion system baseplate subunit TssF [Caballeronia grimmiae]|uniref:type VI secretion system baseplate subunit TssF n=1 Tax=Caballeronia grimmiae TaxID=1071679 RepID=UPI0038BDC735